MDGPILDVHIRDDDPLFGRAVELANEVVAALVYEVFEPSGETTVSMPTLARVVEELDGFPDARLTAMFVFALARCARNMTSALVRVRGCDSEAVLREFLVHPA